MAQGTEKEKGSQKGLRIGNPVSQRLFDLKAAARYLGRPVSGVRSLIWNGRLPYIQEGKKQYVDIEDMIRYIERSKNTMV